MNNEPGDDTPAVPTPLVLAMIICDQFYRDPGTGKLTILGMFSGVGAAAFPARHPVLCVFLALTDCVVPMNLRVRLIDAEEERDPVVQADATVQLPDPRIVGELCLPLKDLVFPEPGEYRMQAFCNGEFLIERRIIITQVGGPPDDQPEPDGSN